MSDPISEICDAFNRMHKEYMDMNIDIKNDDAVNVAYKELSKKYHDILMAFPKIFQWIVYLGEYHPKEIRETITLYFTKIKNTLSTDSDFIDKLIDIYADYPTAVYKKKNPKLRDMKPIYQYKESVKASFRKEFDDIEKEQKEKEEEKRRQLETEIFDILN